MESGPERGRVVSGCARGVPGRVGVESGDARDVPERPGVKSGPGVLGREAVCLDLGVQSDFVSLQYLCFVLMVLSLRVVFRVPVLSMSSCCKPVHV